MPSTERLFDRLRAIIHADLMGDPNRITTSASFRDDLGADSLESIGLVVAMEHERHTSALRMCSVGACDKKGVRLTKGMCSAHYQRWLRHGDPLGGRTPSREIQLFFRDVVLTHDGDECLTWPFNATAAGYGTMSLEGRTQVVSRVVCERTHGPAPSPKYDAAHSCGSGHLGCVSPRHLAWKTRKENVADQLLHGTRSRGIRNGNAKLTESDVVEIRSLRGAGTQREIGSRFGVSATTVSQIKSGISWSWL